MYNSCDSSHLTMALCIYGKYIIKLSPKVIRKTTTQFPILTLKHGLHKA